MVKFEEFQVACYEVAEPNESMAELENMLEVAESEEEKAMVLHAMLVFVAKRTSEMGWTLSEICECE